MAIPTAPTVAGLSLSQRRKTRVYDISDPGLLAFLTSIVTYVTSVFVVKATIGDIKMSYTGTEENGWLCMDGSAFSATAYPELATLLGGATLPNWTGLLPIGATGAGIGAIGAASSALTLTAANLPAHTHDVTIAAHTHTFTSDPHTHDHDLGDGAGGGTGTETTTADSVTGETDAGGSDIVTSSSVGGGAAANVSFPTAGVCYMIFAGG
ncbi:MAG: phage tail protein [Paracoccaceae bacterium]